MEEAKRRCSRTLQYSDTERSSILFPNIDANSGNDITDDYYKDMYCSWDGFECHNSIPCKDTTLPVTFVLPCNFNRGALE